MLPINKLLICAPPCLAGEHSEDQSGGYFGLRFRFNVPRKVDIVNHLCQFRVTEYGIHTLEDPRLKSVSNRVSERNLSPCADLEVEFADRSRGVPI